MTTKGITVPPNLDLFIDIDRINAPTREEALAQAVDAMDSEILWLWRVFKYSEQTGAYTKFHWPFTSTFKAIEGATRISILTFGEGVSVGAIYEQAVGRAYRDLCRYHGWTYLMVGNNQSMHHPDHPSVEVDYELLEAFAFTAGEG